jgi:hypothetical protein
MIVSGNVLPRRDWSYEIISFVVLAVLSALSHFWYILIIFSSALLMRELVGLSFRYLMNSLRLVPWHSWKASGLDMREVHLRHQVFKPSKIS